MIITENVTINDVQYKYTKSSLGYYIQRNDGKKFIDVYDKIDSTFTYIELTSSPKPITVQNINFSQLYPIGSIYIGTMAVCPLEVLGIGVWELKSKGRVLQGANTETPGTTKEAGLPDHYHYVFNTGSINCCIIKYSELYDFFIDKEHNNIKEVVMKADFSAHYKCYLDN